MEKIDVADERFPFSKGSVTDSGIPFAPCDCAICWYADNEIHYHNLTPQASIVNGTLPTLFYRLGIKQGFSVKKLNDACRTCICKTEMHKSFVAVCELAEKRGVEIGVAGAGGMEYTELKALNGRYKEKRDTFHRNNWSMKAME
jgi:hypothetical protein